jgi:hypothetical protein
MDDVDAACAAVLEQHAYRHITLIGKSLGTLALGHRLATDQRMASARAMWLTPLLDDNRLQHWLEQIRQPSLFVIGTADPQYSRDGVVRAESATGGRTVVIDHANHSLEIEGDVWKSRASRCCSNKSRAWA